MFFIPTALADYSLLNSSNSSHVNFVASPSKDFLAVNFAFFRDWQGRPDQIRQSGDKGYYSGNLSVALQGLRAAYNAASNGASSLLTLIPTAGALIGARAREP